MASAIEQELIKATKFKAPKGGYKHRQDEIAALAKAAVKLSDDDFDELTNEAADWVNSAIKAINDKADIRDFVSDDEEPEDDADAANTDQEADEEPDVENNEKVADEADEAEDDVDHEAEEAEQAKQAAKKAEKKPGKDEKPKRKRRPTKEELSAVKTRYDNLTGEKDRYGVIIGTKTHDAVLMYEKGATSKQIQEALGEGPTKAGGRFYNILRKLNEEGHLVERFRDGTFKLIHKDDLPPDRKPKEPRKTKQTRIGAR
jgi:hypothetical protein